MTLTKKEILLKGISELSPIEKVEIIENLLSSFESPSRKEIDDLWALESEKRIDDYESGIIKTKSYEEVFKSINSGK